MTPEEFERAKAKATSLNVSAEGLVEVIRALKEPSEEEKQAKAEEEKREQHVQKTRIERAKTIEANREAVQANCRHTKENGMSAVQGQIHRSNGKVSPICLHCGKEWGFMDPRVAQSRGLYDPESAGFGVAISQ